jgi:hypothetical protein
MASASVTFYPIDVVNRLRQKALKALKIPKRLPEGWSRSKVEINRVFNVFTSLKIKSGYNLRAYQFYRSGNGNGIVWAIPDAEFPEPEKCIRMKDTFLQPPKPLNALDDFMDAIEGDGSPLSYLSASLLDRELCEFGAQWHGFQWTTHTILGAEPWSGEKPLTETQRDRFVWKSSIPTEWKPRVVTTNQSIKVAFFSFTQFGYETIVRHVDTFHPGSYRFDIKETSIATGNSGFIF